jgi:S-adenosylmethionine hydrolase
VQIAFASDYGLADEFVGVCRAVMLGIAPGTEIIDLGHEIPAHDVRAGSLLLVRSVQYLPDDTILLAVVDPGVGTDRRLVAVEVAGGILLGPDNGLLAPATAMIGGPRRVVSLENDAFHLAAPGPTFAGRDILAPVAGHLAAGVSIDELGPPIDPAGMVPAILGLPDLDDDGAIRAEVWWVDRFGNCQLNVDPDVLAGAGTRPGDRVEVRLTDGVRVARWVHTYADAKPSELVVLTDSYGLLSLAFDREPAAAILELHAGSGVTLVPEPASHRRPSIPVRIDGGPQTTNPAR